MPETVGECRRAEVVVMGIGSGGAQAAHVAVAEEGLECLSAGVKGLCVVGT